MNSDINLFRNEIIDFNEFTQKQNSNRTPDDIINQKYEKGEIRIVTEQARYPLDTIPNLVKSEKYNLNPEFQRRHRWNNEKRSKLIESLIINVPIPPIFLYEVSFSNYEVMDGLQRLTAITMFYKDEFELEGLTEWKELNGMRYSNLPAQVKLGIDRRYISSIILLQETAKDERQAEMMKQMVFERINSGGVDLSHQESRNAIYDGPMNRLCIKLSENKKFRRIWQIPDNLVEETLFGYEESKDLEENSLYSNMEDVELVLRFFAFRHLDNYKISLKLFLDYFLKKSNLYEKSLLTSLEKNFIETIDLAYELFDGRPFLFIRKTKNKVWQWYTKPSKLVYDPMMYILSCNLDKKNSFLKNKEKINSLLFDLFKNNHMLFNGRNNNKIDIEKRVRLFKDFFDGILNDTKS